MFWMLFPQMQLFFLNQGLNSKFIEIIHVLFHRQTMILSIVQHKTRKDEIIIICPDTTKFHKLCNFLTKTAGLKMVEKGQRLSFKHLNHLEEDVAKIKTAEYIQIIPRETITADKPNVNESNVNESNVNESNVNESNVNESNVNESNVSESNVGESNVGESNVGESNVGKSNVGESNHGEVLTLLQHIGQKRYQSVSSDSMALAVLYYSIGKNIAPKGSSANYMRLVYTMNANFPGVWLLNFQDTVVWLESLSSSENYLLKRAMETGPHATVGVMGSLMSVHAWKKHFNTMLI